MATTAPMLDYSTTAPILSTATLIRVPRTKAPSSPLDSDEQPSPAEQDAIAAAMREIREGWGPAERARRARLAELRQVRLLTQILASA
ncbi:MAG: hypothetical protein KDA61_12005 [Planctomycetales bacterium]|nr:hypothetical protein [Planctomycetales bacterium]